MKTGPVGCSYTSVRNCHCTLRTSGLSTGRNCFVCKATLLRHKSKESCSYGGVQNPSNTIPSVLPSSGPLILVHSNRMCDQARPLHKHNSLHPNTGRDANRTRDPLSPTCYSLNSRQNEPGTGTGTGTVMLPSLNNVFENRQLLST